MTQAGEAVDDLSGVHGKTSTTVAFDFGRITLDSHNVLYLFGAPGQERFWFLWDRLFSGTLGAVVLVDTRRIDDSWYAIDRLEKHGTPFIVACNDFGGPAFTPEQIREALDLDPHVPLVTCDARSRESSKLVLITLVEHIQTLYADQARAPVRSWCESCFRSSPRPLQRPPAPGRPGRGVPEHAARPRQRGPGDPGRRRTGLAGGRLPRAAPDHRGPGAVQPRLRPVEPVGEHPRRLAAAADDRPQAAVDPLHGRRAAPRAGRDAGRRAGGGGPVRTARLRREVRRRADRRHLSRGAADITNEFAALLPVRVLARLYGFSDEQGRRSSPPSTT